MLLFVVFFLDVNKCHPVSELVSERSGSSVVFFSRRKYLDR